jgi:hypothetical protein
MMKPGACFVFALLMLGVAFGQATKDPMRSGPVSASSRAKMIASLEHSAVRIGDPIILHYHLKNVSAGVIGPISYGFFNDANWIMVTDASGVELPRTKEGDRLRQPSEVGMSGGRLSLSPGGEDEDRIIDLGKLYRLDRPGDYLARIAWRMGVPPGVPFPNIRR